MNPEKIFFTADQHFGHKNIIRWCPDRSHLGAGVAEMDESLIRNWNNTVPKLKAHVFILGDIFLYSKPEYCGRILDRLNGTKYLIAGNHDKKMKPEVQEYFKWIKDYHELKIPIAPKKFANLVLSHYPFETWNKQHYGAYMFHGHAHGSLETIPRQSKILDVGVDSAYHWLNDFRPFTLQEAMEIVIVKTGELS